MHVRRPSLPKLAVCGACGRPGAHSSGRHSGIWCLAMRCWLLRRGGGVCSRPGVCKGLPVGLPRRDSPRLSRGRSATWVSNLAHSTNVVGGHVVPRARDHPIVCGPTSMKQPILSIVPWRGNQLRGKSAHGPKAKCWHVRYLVAIEGKPDVPQTSPKRRG